MISGDESKKENQIIENLWIKGYKIAIFGGGQDKISKVLEEKLVDEYGINNVFSLTNSKWQTRLSGVDLHSISKIYEDSETVIFVSESVANHWSHILVKKRRGLKHFFVSSEEKMADSMAEILDFIKKDQVNLR